MLAMHPQNNNHDIISEHELKKKIWVYKRLQRRVVLMKWITEVKTFANFFFIVLKLKNMNPYVFVFGELKYVHALVFIFFTRCKKCISS